MSKVIENQIAAASTENSSQAQTTQSTHPTEESKETVSTQSTQDVDYDLTVMSSDMVYATVYQMMATPDTYTGKVVRMRGLFYPYTNTAGTVYYPACVIQDATACCAQGIEFVLTGKEYPSGYPTVGAEITVVGTFETYLEDGSTYCHLVGSTLESTKHKKMRMAVRKLEAFEYSVPSLPYFNFFWSV